jgi:hypothetical protein
LDDYYLNFSPSQSFDDNQLALTTSNTLAFSSSNTYLPYGTFSNAQPQAYINQNPASSTGNLVGGLDQYSSGHALRHASAPSQSLLSDHGPMTISPHSPHSLYPATMSPHHMAGSITPEVASHVNSPWDTGSAQGNEVIPCPTLSCPGFLTDRVSLVFSVTVFQTSDLYSYLIT